MEFNGKPIKSVKSGFESAMKLARCIGKVTPHTLRHSAAMTLLKAGVDTSVIALWPGHEGTETTQVYLHADMTIKEQALARVQQPGTSPGRYRAPDSLLAFLDNL